MKIKRIVAFRVIALLMLTALVTIPMVPATASLGPWSWIPGTVHYHCQEDSNRKQFICTYPTDAEILNRTIPYGCQQYYDIVFSTRWGLGNALVNLTIPADTFYSEPFFLKMLGPFYIWMQVYLDEENGTGQLDTIGGNIDVSPIAINITGNGDGTFNVSTQIGDGVNEATAGSAIFTMPLKNDVWLGASETDPTVVQFLFTMDFPMITTTGFIETRIIDETAYPSGSINMTGFYMNLTGVPVDGEGNAAILAGAGAGLDINATITGIGPAYTDYIFTDYEVISPPPPVGGTWIPVDKLALLAPYITLISTIILAISASVAYIKYRKKQ